MEVESKPEEIEISTPIFQLKIEREALKKESDAASKDRLKALSRNSPTSSSSRPSSPPAGRRRRKRSRRGQIKEQLDAARIELEQAQRSGDLAKAGELQYGRIPELEKKLSERAGLKGAMLREEVTDQDIAAVVSRWTGIRSNG
jgi:ATP-dependent Clp protease ATP-binding subunit ClpB